MRTSVGGAVARMLLDGGFSEVFARPPSAREHPEPIVCTQGAFERASRARGEERGTVAVEVLVVRGSPEEAGRDALRAETRLRRCAWEPYAGLGGRMRICGKETSVPGLRERDASGRWVWGFTVTVWVAREL